MYIKQKKNNIFTNSVSIVHQLIHTIKKNYHWPNIIPVTCKYMALL